MSETAEQPTLLQKLWDKKFPQYLGSYLAVGFGLLQFLEFVATRYNWSSRIIDKYLLFWLVILPAVAILIYYRGRLPKGQSKTGLSWQRLLTWGNLIVGGGLAMLLFNSPSQVQAQTLQLMTETGDTLQAVVPNRDIVKTVAVFQFDAVDDAEDTAWWGVAFSDLLFLDLHQRPEYYPQTAFNLSGYYARFDLPMFSEANLATKRKIAQRARTDYFVDAEYSFQEEQVFIEGGLYRTRDGKQLFPLAASNSDPFVAIEELGQQIFKQIPNPLELLETQNSLPVSALFTENIEALREFTLAKMIYFKDPLNLEASFAKAKRSTELDPQCASCHFWCGDQKYGMGQRDEAIAYLKKAVQLSRALPERNQFGFKATLYWIQGQIEKYYQLLEVQRQAYPYDFTHYQALLPSYKVNYGIDSAIHLVQLAIDNGNRERGLLTLSTLYEEKEDFAAAETTLDQFFAEFPDRSQDKTRYASLYEQQGKLKEARSILEEINTTDPFNNEVILQMAYLDHRFGDYNGADSLVRLVLDQSTNLVDSISAYQALSSFAEDLGQVAASLEYFATYEQLSLGRAPLNRVLLAGILPKMSKYLSIGQLNQLEKDLEAALVYSPEQKGIYECLVVIQRIMDDNEPRVNPAEVEGCRSTMGVYGENFARAYDIFLFYLNEDYQKGAARLDTLLDLGIDVMDNPTFRAKVYRKAGKLQKAQGVIEQAIAANRTGIVYYLEMAKIKHETDPEGAKAALTKALRAWENADPDFIPAQQAKALAEELELAL